MRTSMTLLLAMMSTTAMASPIQLAHSGRVLDTDGEPITGSVQLVVQVYQTGNPSVEHTTTFNNHTIEDGFYSVFLDVDTDTFLQPTSVVVRVNGIEVGGPTPLVRVPNAAVADVAARVAVTVASPTGDCGEEGAITWSRADASLYVCSDSGAWAAAGSGGGGSAEVPGSLALANGRGAVWEVPSGVTTVDVRAWGGGGSGGANIGAYGGGGAYVEATLSVVPGETLLLDVGQGGVASTSAGSSGAGASRVVRSGTALLVAGGGGGGGNNGSWNENRTGGAGGAGGGPTGEDGGDYLPLDGFNTYCQDADGGRGGSPSSGGAGGFAQTGQGETLCTAHDGTLSTGGRCNSGTAATGSSASSYNSNGYGGFGGAGYYGGGAGGGVLGYCSAGGGGGSSYVEPTATNVSMVGGTGREPGEPTAGRGGEYFTRGSEGFSFINAADVPGQPGRLELSWVGDGGGGSSTATAPVGYYGIDDGISPTTWSAIVPLGEETFSGWTGQADFLDAVSTFCVDNGYPRGSVKTRTGDHATDDTVFTGPGDAIIAGAGPQVSQIRLVGGDPITRVYTLRRHVASSSTGRILRADLSTAGHTENSFSGTSITDSAGHVLCQTSIPITTTPSL